MRNLVRTLSIAAVAAIAGAASAWIIDPDTTGGRFVILDQATSTNNFIGGDADDSYIIRPALVAPVFFWGQTYSELNLATNGHINWLRTDGVVNTYDSQENTWRMYSQTHAAALPRISFLGEDLNQASRAGQVSKVIENDTADFYAATIVQTKSFGGSREGQEPFHSVQVLVFRNGTTITNAQGSFTFQPRDIAMAYSAIGAFRTDAGTTDPPGPAFRRTTSGTGEGIPVERGQTLSIGLFKGDPTFESDPIFGTSTPIDFGTIVPIPGAPTDGIDSNPQTPDGYRRYAGQLIYGARMNEAGTVLNPTVDERNVIPGFNGPTNKFVLYRWNAGTNTYDASIAEFASAAEEVFPTSFNRLRGRVDAGDVNSLRGDDNNRLRVCRFIVPNDPARIIEVDYLGSTTVASPSSFKLDVRSRSTVGGLVQQTLQVFNYQTNLFDTTDFNQVNLNTTLTTRTVNGTGTLSRLVGPAGALRAKQTIRIVGPVPNPNVCKETTLVRWTLGR